MLRREPTRIEVKFDDIADYQDRKDRAKAQEEAERRAQQEFERRRRVGTGEYHAQNMNPNGEKRHDQGNRQKTRNERLGLGR